MFLLSHFTHVRQRTMHVSKCTEVRHVLLFFLHVSNTLISLCQSFVHSSLSGCHFSFYFFNSFDMTIIFLLLNWFSRYGWFSSKFLLMHLDFLFYGSFTCYKHLLKLGSLSFCFSNCLNMISVCINSWVL